MQFMSRNEVKCVDIEMFKIFDCVCFQQIQGHEDENYPESTMIQEYAEYEDCIDEFRYGMNCYE